MSQAQFTLMVMLLASISLTARAQIQIIIDHNTGAAATSEFKFKRVPSPARDDAASRAKLTLVDGVIDPSGADLTALIDGMLPTSEDEPGANLFFNARSFGGRFRMDLGSVIEIAQVNSYSWHSSARGPQLYKLYASDGTETGLDLAPKRGIDPASRGWKFIATVNTIPDHGQDGGEYGVSITDGSGSLGRYRYLLFDCWVTEAADDWGNTFYSEIDVVAKNGDRVSSDDKVGVPECDDFIARYQACVSAKVPEAARAAFNSAIRQWQGSWRQVASTRQGKADLAAACKQATQQQKVAMKSYGCDF